MVGGATALSETLVGLDEFALDVVAIDPLPAAEEALPRVLDPALDVGLVRGVAGHDGVDHEAAMAGVCNERRLDVRPEWADNVE
jgi:hypothetical protein